MLKEFKFYDSVKRLKGMADILIEHTFPKAPYHVEQQIVAFKKTEVEADGYSLLIHYNKADYDKYLIETFQIIPRNGVFLPFSLVIKLARRVLGNDFLSLIEFYQEGRKNYCWSLYSDKEGNALPSPHDKDIQHKVFEGFEYNVLQPEQVNVY